ncbi:hypothetical protein BCU41_025960 [Vibrio lentus]
MDNRRFTQCIGEPTGYGAAVAQSPALEQLIVKLNTKYQSDDLSFIR